MRKLKLQELNRLSITEYQESEKLPLVIILDNIRSLNNVGSAFRTADALSIEKVFLVGITGTPPHRDIQKTALGAQDVVAWEHKPDITTLIEDLKQEGYTIASVEQAQGSIPLQEYIVEPNAKIALIFGNEVDGVSDKAIALSDCCIEIPQFGTKHSLNVSVSMGIVLWEILRKMKF